MQEIFVELFNLVFIEKEAGCCGEIYNPQAGSFKLTDSRVQRDT